MSRFMLDCSAIRPVDGQARAWFATAQQQGWASPAAGYHEGKVASALLNEASQAVAQAVGGAHAWFAGDPGLAVQEAVRAIAASRPFQVVCTTAVDTDVVLRATGASAAELGLPHQILAVDDQGRVEPGSLPENAILVTNAANQEIGARQRDLGAWRSSTSSALVWDASCAFGWIDLPAGWDAVLLDPRAWGAPAGAWPVVGSQTVSAVQAARSASSADVPAAVTAGLCAQRWLHAAPRAQELARGQVQQIRSRVLAEIPDVEVHGGGDDDLPNVLSISLLYVDAEALQSRLDAAGFAVGSGSACAARSGQPSHVLAAIGGLTSGNLRVGLAPETPEEAVAGFLDVLRPAVSELRAQIGAP